MWRGINVSLTRNSKERSAHFIGEWSYLVVTLSRAREAKLYFGVRDMESREDSSQNTRDVKVRNAFSNKAVVTQWLHLWKIGEEAGGAKIHLGVSVIATWSIEILHHRNRDMRDHDEIWTVVSFEISTIDHA
jgi:hypothetical protein